MMMSVDIVANEGDFFLKSSDWREYFSKSFEQKRKKKSQNFVQKNSNHHLFREITQLTWIVICIYSNWTKMKRIFIFYIHVLLSKVGHENVLIYSKQASRGKVKLTTVFNSSSSHPQVIPKSSPSHLTKSSPSHPQVILKSSSSHSAINEIEMK